jgi:hypothetical protein
MSLVVEGQTYQWEGGTLEELLALLAEAALSVRVEAIHPEKEEKLGELHVVAGGVSETIAGEKRGDAAMAYLRQIPGLRFLAHPVLPDPEEGNLGNPGPLEGTLTQRPVPELMRYCENFVLTCAVEIRHLDDQVRISYRRGEILRTLVNGSESGERLPEVMSWTDGTWRISMPQLTLPRPPKAARPVRTGAAATLESSTIFGYQVQPPPNAPFVASSSPPVASAEPPPPAVVSPAATAPTAPVVLATVTAAPPAANANAGNATAPAAPDKVAVTPMRRLSDGPTPQVETVARAPAATKPAEKPDGQLTATPGPESLAPTSTQAIRTRSSGGSLLASLFFHALLGVALGLAIVGGYWAFLRWGGALRLG